jgi:alanine-glyoxylate transaminase/serine-glyoxylate transaminase/serine-pyruvate transaminase
MGSDNMNYLESFPELQNPPRILLGPGPSMVHPRVLRAMASPLVGHLDPYFLEIMERTQDLLRMVFETQNRLAIPISGTGSASMEASLANMIEPGDEILICINGYFGLRLVDMAQRYGAEIRTIDRPWGEVFTADEVQEALAQKGAKIVAIVHAETSTGALQPLEDISQVVHENGGLLLVDAVTSLGGIPVQVDEIGIDVCYSGSQNSERKNQVANWYLDLTMIQKYWGSERTYHHTAPISANFALYEGLRIIAEEGLEARWERHRRNAEILWQGLENLGMELHVPLANRLPSLTTVRIPEDVDGAQIQSRLMMDYKIEIAGGLGELKGKVWRIGLMGYSSRLENVTLLLAALEECLRS